MFPMDTPHRLPQRRSIRFPGYDYRLTGLYFVTICTHGRRCLFGEISGESVLLNALGQIAEAEWLRSSELRREIALDAHVIMPNHLNAIVAIDQAAHPSDSTLGVRNRSLSSLINGFKAAATRRINELRGTLAAAVWQRNYYEHVVRNEGELNRIREYIALNPVKWAADRENPAALRTAKPTAAWEV
jgi:REP element-mobilizing transposase RayT